MSISHQLDILQLPLRGQHLIEASAGTGKTYTLASLVIRLLLGHGDYPPLTIEKILVVTFTNAATEELRERIRQKIILTYQAFLGCPCADDTIMALVQQTPTSEHQQARQWLDLALRSLDNSAVLTIHKFCHKLLGELAFEAGQLFEQRLILDHDHWLQQACQDAWRQLCYASHPTVLAGLYPYVNSPKQLQEKLQHVLNSTPLKSIPHGTSFAQASADFIELINNINSNWQTHQRLQLAYLKELDLDKRTYGKPEAGYPKLQAAWTALTTWLEQPDHVLPSQIKILCWSKLRTKVNKKSMPVNQAELNLLLNIDVLLEEQQKLQVAFFQTARTTTQRRLQRLKDQASILFADDLMVQLQQAITAHPQRQLLIELIRNRFPVALIDEFQDTDPIQFNLFETLYRHQSQLGWYMIGDPKQAIYAFRGADIFTYMHAKASTPNQHHLTTNFRSASDMVDAVNHLFTTAHNPFIYDMITYQPVMAHQSQAPLQLPNDTAALHLRYQASECTFSNKADATLAAAEDCAQHITDILNQAQLGQAQINGRPLEPRDIAVLVHSATEAKHIAKALAKRQVGSVFLSRERVFDTAEAEAMGLILKAMAHPKQELAIRNALATHLIGRTHAQINQFNHDEDERCFWLDKFAQYHQIWHQQNWLVAFAQCMLDCQMAARLLQQPTGERQLTDVRHLGELIQTASQQLTGTQALLNWYEHQCYQQDMPADMQQLRLESEHNLITIMTIHKSKGLEYNLCWLPFLSLVNQPRNHTMGKIYHDESHQLLWDCNPDSTAKAKVEQEKLAESMRLLYVAFTRAKYRVYTHIVQVTPKNKPSSPGNFHQSALGYLLGCHNEMSTDELLLHLQTFVQAPHTGLTPISSNRAVIPLSATNAQTPTELRVLPPIKPKQSPWWLSSYSGLVRHLVHSHRTPDDDTVTTSQPHLQQRFAFEKGAHIGNFLHQIFENIDFADPDSLSIQLPLLMARYQIDVIHESMLHTWITQVLATELQPHLCLNQLQPHQVFKELEFFMPLQTLTASDFNQLLQAHHYPPTPMLNFETLQGMLKGFVDLVFEWEGRYYIADYKSNFLGTHEQDYAINKLQQAVNEHRYDVQYLLYTVALHLMLQQKVTDYQYDTHFGGCYYLFVRGMQPNQTQGVFFDRPNQAMIETLAQYFQHEVKSTC